MTTEQENNIIEWVKAIRSGEYKQGTMFLASSTKDEEYQYCCLGVACEIKKIPFEKSTLKGISTKTFSWKNKEHYKSKSVPEREWFFGTYGFDYDRSINVFSSLVAMNDIAQITFEKIADVIEKEFLC